MLFWLSLACLAGVAWFGWNNRWRGWGLPGAAIALTVIAWYHGDAIYNGYTESFTTAFSPSVLVRAWLQVCLFGLAFAAFISFVPERLNRTCRGKSSYMESLLSGRRSVDSLQRPMTGAAYGIAAVWLALFVLALWRTQGNLPGLLAPYLGYEASPWGRGQVAESWFDSLATIFASLAILCAAFLGICGALLKNSSARALVILLILLSWPGYLFDRTRHVILVIVLPGLLAYTFVRLRGRGTLQVAVLLAAFLGINLWFKFIIANRTERTIASAFSTSGPNGASELGETKHLGLNMFEELCWINHLTTTGTYKPVWGELYLANLVNPIPRALWPHKPTMGLDYAIARGQRGDESSGVTATVATGMIGSGVVNFGGFFGPIAAAFLMSLWCAFLARLDLTANDPGRLLIYVVGCVSIFNFGRDITFLVAYPTLFGFGLLWLYRRVWPIALSAGRRAIPKEKRPDQLKNQRTEGTKRTERTVAG